MDQKTLKSIIAQIHRRFPEVAGSQPKVQRQTPASAGRTEKPHQPKSGTSPSTYLLTFHGKSKTSPNAQGKTISRWVRVVVNDQGKILKVTTSR